MYIQIFLNLRAIIINCQRQAARPKKAPSNNQTDAAEVSQIMGEARIGRTDKHKIRRNRPSFRKLLYQRRTKRTMIDDKFDIDFRIGPAEKFYIAREIPRNLPFVLHNIYDFYAIRIFIAPDIKHCLVEILQISAARKKDDLLRIDFIDFVMQLPRQGSRRMDEF